MDASGLPAGWKWGTDYAKVPTCIECGDECVVGRMITVTKGSERDYYCSESCLQCR